MGRKKRHQESNHNHNHNNRFEIYVEPKTKAQRRFIDSIRENKLTICDGPAGCGKTFLAAALSAQLLQEYSKYDHIIIVRPAITACNEKLGFLPGNIDRKMEPFTVPVLYNLSKAVGKGYFYKMNRGDVIKVIPLAYMRGMTLDNCIVIFDEAQNSTPEQMKMFLTRIGENCKVIVEGDEEQSDIRGKNGLMDAIDRLEGMQDVGIIEMDLTDVVRSGFVANILSRYEE